MRIFGSLFTAAGLVTKLTGTQNEKRLGRMLKELAKVNLLIIDELSYVLSRQGKKETLFDCNTFFPHTYPGYVPKAKAERVLNSTFGLILAIASFSGVGLFELY